MDEVCGVWTGFPRPGLCSGGCQYFEIGQLSQMEAFKKAFIKKITFPVRHRAVFCIWTFLRTTVVKQSNFLFPH